MRARAWALAILLLGACSGGGGAEETTESDRDYIETTRFEFVRQCERDGSAEDECLRVLECVEDELSFEEYVQLDLDRAAGYPVERLDKVLAQCADA